jgi:hypothetical protein
MTRRVFVLASAFALILTTGSSIPNLVARGSSSWENADACIAAYQRLASVQSTYSTRLMATAVALGKKKTPPFSVASLQAYMTKTVAPAAAAVITACTPTGATGPGAGPTAADLVASCGGMPVTGAAAYAGTVHPLVVVSGGKISDAAFPINGKWLNRLWPGPLQLVVCADAEIAQVESCGSYTRRSDGVSGEVLAYRYSQAVQVYVATTGRWLQSQAFTASAPTCSDTLFGLAGPPPWKIYGDHVSADAINQYATTVATQTVQ